MRDRKKRRVNLDLQGTYLRAATWECYRIPGLEFGWVATGLLHPGLPITKALTHGECFRLHTIYIFNNSKE